jgi:hypothetical protein
MAQLSVGMADYNSFRAARSSLSTPICSSVSGVKGGRGGPTCIGVMRFIAAFIAGTQPPVEDNILFGILVCLLTSLHTILWPVLTHVSIKRKASTF